MYLAAESPAKLISKIFNLCSSYVEGVGENTGILSRVLSVLYASRHGLSDDEIWGSVEMAMGRGIPMVGMVRLLCVAAIQNPTPLSTSSSSLLTHSGGKSIDQAHSEGLDYVCGRFADVFARGLPTCSLHGIHQNSRPSRPATPAYGAVLWPSRTLRPQTRRPALPSGSFRVLVFKSESKSKNIQT